MPQHMESTSIKGVLFSLAKELVLKAISGHKGCIYKLVVSKSPVAIAAV